MILREDDERPCPPVIRDVLVKRDGWSLYDESVAPEDQPPFHLFWKTNRFYPSQINACVYPYQRCNHYPKSSEITKKDGLYRHMKRMRVVHGAGLFNFVPETFTLPNEYVKFCQFFADERDKAQTLHEQQQQQGSSASGTTIPATTALPSCGNRNRGPNPLFICKPAELSRGRKIFVFDDIGELTYDCSSVVQRYVDRPLLIFGHKVDFRIYVLVTSFQPLRMYIYDNFLTRFSGEEYNTDSKDNFVHLTNYSVTKTSTSDALRNAGVGETCKWDGDRTREYFASCGVDFSLLWTRIETLVRCTVLSIFHLVPQKQQCFELYGFDILFDEQLQPWLIEANFSPALAVESDVDVRVKHGLIHDLVQTLNIQQRPTVYGGSDDDVETPDISSRGVQAPSPTTNRPPRSGGDIGGCHKSTTPVPKKSSSFVSARTMQTKASGADAAPMRVGRDALPRVGSAGARTQSSQPPTLSGPSAQAARSVRGTPPAGNGAAAVRGARTQRSSSSSVLSRLAPPPSSTSSPSGGGGTASSSLTFVDKAYGRMKLIFPFNNETEKYSLQALQPGALESTLKLMLAEVRKVDARAAQQLRPLAAVYAERSRKPGTSRKQQQQ
jgi:tubulin polyglutamylase TTLL2